MHRTLQERKAESRHERRRTDQGGGQQPVQADEVPHHTVGIWSSGPGAQGVPDLCDHRPDVDGVVSAEIGDEPLEPSRVPEQRDERREAQGGVGAGGGLRRQESQPGPPDASRHRAARRRAEPDAREVQGQQGAEREGGRFQHHPQHPEPHHFQRQRDESRHGEESGPGADRQAARTLTDHRRGGTVDGRHRDARPDIRIGRQYRSRIGERRSVPVRPAPAGSRRRRRPCSAGRRRGRYRPFRPAAAAARWCRARRQPRQAC